MCKRIIQRITLYVQNLRWKIKIRQYSNIMQKPANFAIALGAESIT